MMEKEKNTIAINFDDKNGITEEHNIVLIIMIAFESKVKENITYNHSNNDAIRD